MGLEESRVSKRALSVSGTENENGAADWTLVHGPSSTSGVSKDPPSVSIDSEWIGPINAPTYRHGLGGGESSGMTTTLGRGFSSPPPHIPQWSDSHSALPMRLIDHREGHGSVAGGAEFRETVLWSRETLNAPVVPPAAGVYMAAGREEGMAQLSGRSAKKRSRRGHGQMESTAVNVGEGEGGVQEGQIDAGVGRMTAEAVDRPLGGKDNLEVAFDVGCRAITELSMEGRIDVTRVQLHL